MNLKLFGLTDFTDDDINNIRIESGPDSEAKPETESESNSKIENENISQKPSQTSFIEIAKPTEVKESRPLSKKKEIQTKNLRKFAEEIVKCYTSEHINSANVAKNESINFANLKQFYEKLTIE